MNTTTLKAWFKQPTTILGISGFVATVSGIIAHVLTHDMTATVAAATIAGSAVHVVMPDNSGAQSSIEKLVTDAVTAAAQQRLAAALPLLVQDGLAVVGALSVPAAVAPVAVSSAPAGIPPIATPNNGASV